MADLKDYAALFGDDFGDIAEAFEKGIPDDLENLLVGVIEDIAFAAAGFSTQMAATVNTMLSTGMSVEFVEDTLRSNLQAGTGPFAKLKNDIKKACTRGVNQSSRLGQYKTYFTDKELSDLGTKSLWAWVNVSGHRICVDCAGRAGDIQTFADWEKEGLPGAGSTVCSSYCYCVLDPIGKLKDTIEIKGEKVKFHKISATDAAAVVNREVKLAQAAKKELTQKMDIIRARIGADLHGLKYATKDQSSTLRKFLKENVDNGWTVQQIKKKNLSDLNRYTFIIDDATYADDVFKAFDLLEEQGFKKLKVKNYWDGDLYKGLNTNWIDPKTGRKIEIQFNTQAQQGIKDKYSHKLYEIYRDVNATKAARAEAKEQLQYYWNLFQDGGKMPNGWEQIQTYP